MKTIEDAVKRFRKRVIRSYKSGEVWMYHFIYLLNDGTGVDMGKAEALAKAGWTAADIAPELSIKCEAEDVICILLAWKYLHLATEAEQGEYKDEELKKHFAGIPDYNGSLYDGSSMYTYAGRKS